VLFHEGERNCGFFVVLSGGTIMSLLGAAVLTIPVILIVEFTNSAADSVRSDTCCCSALPPAAASSPVACWAATVAAPRLPGLCQIARHSTS